MYISKNKATGDSWADKRWEATECFKPSQARPPIYRMCYLCNDWGNEGPSVQDPFIQVSRDEKWIPDTLLRALSDYTYCMSLGEQHELECADESVKALMSTVSKFSYYKLGLLNYTIAADLTCNLQQDEGVDQESSEADIAKDLRFDEFDQIISYVWQMFKSPMFLNESGIIEEFLHYWRGTGACFESGYLRHILGSYGFIRLNDYEAEYFERKRDERFKDLRVFVLNSHSHDADDGVTVLEKLKQLILLDINEHGQEMHGHSAELLRHIERTLEEVRRRRRDGDVR